MEGYSSVRQNGLLVEKTAKNGAGVSLKRDNNTTYAICLIAGIIIGSGIFVSPVSITEQCGSIIYPGGQWSAHSSSLSLFLQAGRHLLRRWW